MIQWLFAIAATIVILFLALDLAYGGRSRE
jgi:hypothetical protein